MHRAVARSFSSKHLTTTFGYDDCKESHYPNLFEDKILRPFKHFLSLSKERMSMAVPRTGVGGCHESYDDCKESHYPNLF